MSKQHRIGLSRLLVSAMVTWYKKACERLASGPNIGRPLEVEFCGERIELRKLTKLLSIGDRIRILCDDGVLVAEKISHAHFRVIQCQASAELVH
jgi:hypothetical protein